MTSRRANRYPPELRERAVRMLLEQRSEYRSEYAAINYHRQNNSICWLPK
ncbi:hypothetical protein [Serratia marcescens]|nr:hypothetical protein [Serratia marcescens]UJA57008.1 hypothetical protein L1F17_22435 [Serratia marcescens]